ncbi:hypothetical protein [Arthrobacter sp. SX1312]|uniref:hypothetical protein n=1 Tax=Arthrobacter sp. SX1312 TaxID=2058896 RepID=UPI0011B04816|nr:hypothetical protein [Arthrobacter sp. SX1312]
MKPRRADLFAWFLSEAGLRQLDAWLTSGLYRLDLPEHGALLSVAWLRQHGRADDASELVRVLEPWAGRVRFWPYALTEPEAPGMHVATLPVVAGRLARKRPQRHVEAEREALSVWSPFTDKVLNHWWVTRSSEGTLGSVMSPDWIDGAKDLLTEYRGLAAENTLTKRHANPKGNLQILLAGLSACVAGEPSPRVMGQVRTAAANMVAKRGEPGSSALAGLRAAQARTAAEPSHAALAHDAAARLQATGRRGAVEDPVALLRGTPAEAVRSVRATTRQATQAPLPALLRHGIVRSAEMVAELAPQITAETVASRYANPPAGLLAKRLHLAFANRRSTLLLNRQSQVTIQALPWFALLEQAGVHDQEPDLAHAQAVDLAALTLRHFPGTLLPNSLIRELTRLFGLASEDVPLTYELASDIFMGSFSPVFQRAAQDTAPVVGGTLYANYYGIDYDRIMTMRAVQERSSRARFTPRAAVPEFDALVRSRAGVGPARWATDVVDNGRLIEQAQILTAQNLAVLVSAGVQLDWETQAREAWNAAKDHLSKTAGAKNLRHRKNAAIAWRQAIFYLSLSSDEQAADFAHDETLVEGLSPEITTWAEVIIRGLRETLETGAPADDPFLGWVARPDR